MPIQSTDIKIYLSGGVVNSDPNAALGGAISSIEVVDNTLHNLFDKVQGAESQAGDTEYRAVFVKNTHVSLTLQSAKVYIDTNTPSGGTNAQISVATESGSPIQSVANENTVPISQTFSDAVGEANALTIGDLVPGAVKGLWIKRVVNVGAAAYANDSVIVKVFGDTDA